MTRDEEIASLEAKLAASERMGPGYARRIEAIQARIDELKRAADDS